MENKDILLLIVSHFRIRRNNQKSLQCAQIGNFTLVYNEKLEEKQEFTLTLLFILYCFVCLNAIMGSVCVCACITNPMHMI